MFASHHPEISGTTSAAAAGAKTAAAAHHSRYASTSATTEAATSRSARRAASLASATRSCSSPRLSDSAWNVRLAASASAFSWLSSRTDRRRVCMASSRERWTSSISSRSHESTSTLCSRSSRSEEHTSELQSRLHLVCRLLLEKKKTIGGYSSYITRLPIAARTFHRL